MAVFIALFSPNGDLYTDEPKVVDSQENKVMDHWSNHPRVFSQGTNNQTQIITCEDTARDNSGKRKGKRRRGWSVAK